jgi:hypothetical protein
MKKDDSLHSIITVFNATFSTSVFTLVQHVSATLGHHQALLLLLLKLSHCNCNCKDEVTGTGRYKKERRRWETQNFELKTRRKEASWQTEAKMGV